MLLSMHAMCMYTNDANSFLITAGLGSMGCGRGMQICTQIKTWFTLLALVITRKIGFMLKLQGALSQTRHILLLLFSWIM